MPDARDVSSSTTESAPAVQSAALAAQRSRVEAALAGDLLLRALTSEEGVVVHAEISAAIEANLAAADFGADFAEEGVTTVALDEDGQLTEHHPDGTNAVPG